MNRLLFLAIILLAQFNSMDAQVQVGAGLTYQTKFKKAGFQIRGTYGIKENIEGSAGINFIFREKIEGIKTSLLAFNFDGHYLIPMEKGFNVYPLAGINIIRTSVKFDNSLLGSFSTSATKIGLNLGGGLAYPISEKMKMIIEVKTVLASENTTRLNLFAGANYAF